MLWVTIPMFGKSRKKQREKQGAEPEPAPESIKRLAKKQWLSPATLDALCYARSHRIEFLHWLKAQPLVRQPVRARRVSNGRIEK